MADVVTPLGFIVKVDSGLNRLFYILNKLLLLFLPSLPLRYYTGYRVEL